MKVGRWSTTAGNNNSTPPDGWPEGQAPSTVNDCAREMMASIRTLVSDIQYIDHDYTPTFINATSFSVPGNQTSAIHAGRRVKLFDGSTIYATVSTASFTTVTTINISASANITSSLSSFGLSILSNAADAIPRGLGRFTPVGGIIMWSGSIASVPQGWALCDGTNGTPDLRNRFIVGAGSTYAVAATGGTADASVVTHSHAVTATGTSGGQSQTHSHAVNDPGHAHTLNVGPPQGGPNAVGDNTGVDHGVNTNSVGTGITLGNASQDHTHTTTVTGSASATGVSAVNMNLPPYYALAYIMCLG